MTIDEINELWEKDSYVDPTALDSELLNISRLHCKYFKIYSQEKFLLVKYETELNKLKSERVDYWVFGSNEETLKKGLPNLYKKYDRNDIGKLHLMDGDEEVMRLSVKTIYQKDKVDLLDAIIKSFANRGYNIRSAIDYRKFIASA